ncbi:MAG TPA: hypothetical protein VM736_04140, partial [Gemmatimonadales bacterium]|nr:hypothetical protein [Gemmatimonadales bacterium]
VHRFVPVNSTCAQSGCHVSVRITLAKMSRQTDLHCAMCHRFTAEVPALATRDSARGTLVPQFKQCVACHAMQAVLAQFDPAKDPHRGTCGDCHDPHVQQTAAEAAQTCTSAKCHATWRANPFHVGKNHRAVAAKCTLCHEPHHARVDASDCAGCHTAVKARRAGRRSNPPLPFDTTAALRRVSLAPFSPQHGKGDGPFFDDPPTIGPSSVSRLAADTFPHTPHKSFSCITCHTSRSQRNRLTFQPPRGCQICHHQAPHTSNCATCHQGIHVAAPESVLVRVRVADRGWRDHRARFDHVKHGKLECVACHTTPVTLDPDSNSARCATCHDDHHAQGRRCAACHPGDGPEFRAAHTPPVEAHVACDACHAPEIVARFVPDRGFCVACHQEQRDHYASRECTVCHFGALPAAFRPRLSKTGGPS